MSGQDQYGDYDYTRRGSSDGGEYEGQQDYNGRSGDGSGQYGGQAGVAGQYGGRRAEGGYGRGTADPSGGYPSRTGEQPQAGEYEQPSEYGAREYRSYRRGEYRPRSDYSRSGEYATRTGYGRRGADADLGGGGGGEPPRTRGDVIGVIASSLFAVLAVLALVAVVYIVLTGNNDDSPSTAPTSSDSPTGSTEPTGDGSTAPVAEKAPVIVLNSTNTTGLAAKARDDIQEQDWETGEPGNYDGDQLQTTTVFFPDGMEGSAQLLQEEFPDIGEIKPAEEGMSTSSLTLVLGADWPTS